MLLDAPACKFRLNSIEGCKMISLSLALTTVRSSLILLDRKSGLLRSLPVSHVIRSGMNGLLFLVMALNFIIYHYTIEQQSLALKMTASTIDLLFAARQV